MVVNRFELTPNPFSFEKSVFFVSIVLVVVIILISISPKLANLYLSFPEEASWEVPVILFASLIAAGIAIALIVWFSAKGKRIRIEKNFLIAENWQLFRGWQAKVVDLNKVASLKDRLVSVWVPTGKTIIPVSWYNLVFIADSVSQEVSTYGWDKKNLRLLVEYIRKHFPQIKIDTFLHRDSLEKTSGISEYLASVKRSL